MFKSDDPNENFEDVTVNEPKDVSCKHDTLVVQEKPSEAYTFKSEDPSFWTFQLNWKIGLKNRRRMLMTITSNFTLLQVLAFLRTIK